MLACKGLTFTCLALLPVVAGPAIEHGCQAARAGPQRVMQGAPASQPAGPTPTALVHKLLLHPRRLQLAGSAKSRQTFFFRLFMREKTPPLAATALVASKAGHVAVVIYDAQGSPYAYYGGGIFVLANTLHPGGLTVILGASPLFVFGSLKADGPGPPHRAKFTLASFAGSNGAVAVDFSGPIWSAFKNAPRVTYSPSEHMLAFAGRAADNYVTLCAGGAAFPIKAWSVREPGRAASFYDITSGAQPVERLFAVTLAKVRALGLPLTIVHYVPGQTVGWLPPADFGSNPAEARAMEALGQLIPISRRRLLLRRRQLFLQALDGVALGGHAGRLAFLRVYTTMEWGPGPSVFHYAGRLCSLPPRLAFNYYWNFNRAKYHTLLVHTWGKAVMRRLMQTLERLALRKKSSPVQRFAAIDLLSDIGPDPSCSDWVRSDGPLAKALAAVAPDTWANRVLVAMLRVRWGMPLRPKELAAILQVLPEQKVAPLLRTRILEALCFIHELPYSPKVIVPLVVYSLKHPAACLSTGVPYRYLYDLSLCRIGRRILLEQWEHPHSPLSLAGQQQLELAAFDRLWPGSPGYHLAIAAALKVFHGSGYDRTMRRQAISALCHAPRPIFLIVARQILKGRSDGTSMIVDTMGARKMAKALMPAVMGLFPHLGHGRLINLMSSVAFGFPKGADARSAVPLIQMALRAKRPLAVRMGVNAIEDMNYTHVHLPFARLYPALLRMVRAGAKYRLWMRAQVAYCFGLATLGQWSLPAAGLAPPEVGGPDVSTAGRAWWRVHYAAVRSSALRWAAAHPDYSAANRHKR